MMALTKNKSFLILVILWTLFILLSMIKLHLRSDVSSLLHAVPSGLAQRWPRQRCHLSNSTGHNTSYLLALSMGEQLSASSKIMFHLAPLAADWSAQLVEPVVLTSRLFGIEGIVLPDSEHTGQTSIKLSEIYDISEIKRILQTHVSPPVNMVSFEEFLATASRTVTLLHFVRFGEGNMDFVLNRTESDLVRNHFQTNNSTALFECSHLRGVSKWVDKVEMGLNKFTKSRTVCKEFVVDKVFCFDITMVYRSEVILKHLSQPGTVIFTQWHGCGIRGGHCSVHYRQNSELQVNSDQYRYAILTEALLEVPKLQHMHTLHNPGIAQVAEKVLNTMNYRKPHFMSVHLRAERLILDGQDIKCCLETLKQALDKFKVTNNLNETLLITDVGSEYGSFSWKKHCGQKNISSYLSSFHLTSTSYDPKVSNGTENSAYVSLVEMNMLSMGEKLVLVGRGGFQTILKDKFLSLNHTEADVYHVCDSPLSCQQKANITSVTGVGLCFSP